MAAIATLASDLQMLAKYLGIARTAGLPDTFYQRVIDDPEYRERFVTAVTTGFETADIRLPVTPRDFPVWRTVTLGRHKTAAEYSQAIEKADTKLSDWARDILKKMPLATELVEIELVMVSVEELGFTSATRRDEIYRRAKELGLELCPAEVGPALREQYPDQPLDEWLLIAMEPIAVSAGGLRVFSVDLDRDGQWLHTGNGHPGLEWSPDGRWLFSRSKR